MAVGQSVVAVPKKLAEDPAACAAWAEKGQAHLVGQAARTVKEERRQARLDGQADRKAKEERRPAALGAAALPPPRPLKLRARRPQAPTG